MNIAIETNQAEWDSFLLDQTYSPFLQSWTMGEVYQDTNQEPIRVSARQNGRIVGICLAIVVPARRGRHLSIPYGPVTADTAAIAPLLEYLKKAALERHCHFIRLSPFWPDDSFAADTFRKQTDSLPSPLHLLGEHVWYLPLKLPHPWQQPNGADGTPRTEDELQADMRKTTRNLIRRAAKEGVTIRRSENPIADLESFIELHEETRKRHGFTPYTNTFFRSQVERFSQRNECTLYQAWYNDEVIAASVHMHMGGETSYHHGASTHKYAKIPASYLLQWTAIQDALQRGDHTYSFWGIAPVTRQDDKWVMDKAAGKHPFAGVTTFKTGFGGELLPLLHCRDIPLSRFYYVTRWFETIRKWRRGF